MLKPCLLCTLLLATPAFADSQAIPPGQVLTPTQIGHAFASACFTGTPALMQDRAGVIETAFFFEPIDLGTDAGWIDTAVGAITLTVDGNPIETTCAMAMPTDLVGDGSDLTDSITAHLSAYRDGDLPDATAIDGGTRWQWDGTNASFTLDLFIGEAVLISLTGES